MLMDSSSGIQWARHQYCPLRLSSSQRATKCQVSSSWTLSKVSCDEGAKSVTDCRHCRRGSPHHEVYSGQAALFVPIGRGCRALAVSVLGSRWGHKLKLSVSSHSIRNAESARVSVPSYIVPEAPESTRQIWRTDLLATEPFWAGKLHHAKGLNWAYAKNGMPASATGFCPPNAPDFSSSRGKSGLTGTSWSVKCEHTRCDFRQS